MGTAWRFLEDSEHIMFETDINECKVKSHEHSFHLNRLRCGDTIRFTVGITSADELCAFFPYLKQTNLLSVNALMHALTDWGTGFGETFPNWSHNCCCLRPFFLKLILLIERLNASTKHYRHKIRKGKYRDVFKKLLVEFVLE